MNTKLLTSFIFFITLFNLITAIWIKVFEDNFRGNSLDSTKWYYSSHCNDHELQCYTVDRRENVNVKNGKLIITPKVEKWNNKSYTSSRINSIQSWTYGKFEVRAKLPNGKHLWPAIWMMPANNEYGKWAASGEIDILEYRGQRRNQILGTIHFGGIRPFNKEKGSKEKNFTIDFSNSYNVFSIEWQPNSIKWFVNNQSFHGESLAKNFWSRLGPNPYAKDGQPFDKAFYLILNVAVGGQFFPKSTYGRLTKIEAKKWPKPSFEIDFVRVYQWK